MVCEILDQMDSDMNIKQENVWLFRWFKSRCYTLHPRKYVEKNNSPLQSLLYFCCSYQIPIQIQVILVTEEFLPISSPVGRDSTPIVHCWGNAAVAPERAPL
jgi:hypothetical protein